MGLDPLGATTRSGRRWLHEFVYTERYSGHLAHSEAPLPRSKPPYLGDSGGALVRVEDVVLTIPIAPFGRYCAAASNYTPGD